MIVTCLVERPSALFSVHDCHRFNHDLYPWSVFKAKGHCHGLHAQTGYKIVINCTQFVLELQATSSPRALVFIVKPSTVIRIALAGLGTPYINYSILTENRDLEDFTVMTSSNNLVTFALSFNEISDASGAMLSFVFMDNGDPDFSRSVLLPCSTNPFHNVTLHPGSYLVHGYDIERNRLLYPGISNPVVTRVLQVDGDIDGMVIWYLLLQGTIY